MESSEYSNIGSNQHFTKAKVAPPRLCGKRVGVFSTRSPHRPNLIGLTLAKLESIEGTKVNVSGIDLIKGTPILDIKPYIPEYDIPSGLLPPFSKDMSTKILDGAKEFENTDQNKENKSQDPAVINCYESNGNCAIKIPNWIETPGNLRVFFTRRALQDIANIVTDKPHDAPDKDQEQMVDSIVSILQADPRSNYRKQKCSDRLYFFTMKSTIHITAWFDERHKNNRHHNVNNQVETFSDVFKVVVALFLEYL